MWTCGNCGREFANEHQWHSCIELSLEAALAGATDHARHLYEAIERAVVECGPVRIHPQRTRIAFITTMTFASVRLTRRWVDLSLISPEPIDDRRIRRLACYGATTFEHVVRLHDADELDATVRTWLCRSWRRGNRDTLDPTASVNPLSGRPLELVVVPLRARVVEHDDGLALQLPRYAADVFAAHRHARARLEGAEVHGTIEPAGDRWLFRPAGHDLRRLAVGADEAVDVSIRADF